MLPIWEGTTSVLSLDVLRVLGGSPQAATTFLRQCATRLASAATAGQQAAGSGSARAPLQQACTALQSSIPGVAERLEAAAAAPASPEAQVEARQLAFAMARLFVGGQFGNNRESCGEELACWVECMQLLAPSPCRQFVQPRSSCGCHGVSGCINRCPRTARFPPPAVLLAEHAAWSGEEEHALLALEWCREHLGAEGTSSSSSSPQTAAQAQLHTARVLSGADRSLPQPRARY